MSTDTHTRPANATLKSIATALDMSISGVSIALRNDPSIPHGTCERVQAEAKRQGYRRNPLVSAFCANRRPTDSSGLTTLAYIWHGKPGKDTDAHFQFYKGACEGAEQLNYRLNTFDPVALGIDHSRLDDILQARGIQGVIVAPPFPFDANIALNWERYAVVSIGINLSHPITHNVSLDNFETLHSLFHELRQRGFKRPGLVLSQEFDQRIHHQWSSAYLSYIHQFDDPGDACLFYEHPQKLDTKSIADWVIQNKVDVVLGHRASLMGGLQNLGLNIPEEIAFVTMQGNRSADGIASIKRNSRHIGQLAVEMLIGELHRNQRGLPALPKRMRILGHLIPAASLESEIVTA